MGGGGHSTATVVKFISLFTLWPPAPFASAGAAFMLPWQLDSQGGGHLGTDMQPQDEAAGDRGREYPVGKPHSLGF